MTVQYGAPREDVHLTIYQGSVFDHPLDVVDINGDPIPVGDWADVDARCTMLLEDDKSTPYFQLNTDVGIVIDSANSQIRLQISDLVSDKKLIKQDEIQGKYDVELITAEGSPKLLYRGEFTLVASPSSDPNIVPGPDDTNVASDPTKIGYIAQQGVGLHDTREFKVADGDKAGLSVTNGAGILGDTVYGLDIDSLDSVGQIANEDIFVTYDVSTGENRNVTKSELFSNSASQRTSDLNAQAAIDSAHDAAIALVQTNLDDYETSNDNAVGVIDTALANETIARTNADAAIVTTITANETARDSQRSNDLAAQVVKDTAQDTAIAGVASDLATETTNRTNADNTLQANINAVQTDVDSNEATQNTYNTNEATRVDASIATKVSLTGDETIAGVKTMQDDLIAEGDVYITGTLHNVSSDVLEVGDSWLQLLTDVTGTPSLDAGIEVERGTSTNAVLFWDESADEWVAGTSGNAIPIVLNNDSRLTDARTPTTHNHDDLYYTESEVDAFISTLNTDVNGRALTIHTHTESDITDLDKYTQAQVDALDAQNVKLTGNQSIAGQLSLSSPTGLLSQSSTTGWNSIVMNLDGAIQGSRTSQIAMQRDGVNKFQIFNYDTSSVILNKGDTGDTAIQFYDDYINIPGDFRIAGMGTNAWSATTKEYVDNNFVQLATAQTITGVITFTSTPVFTDQTINGVLTSDNTEVEFAKNAMAPSGSSITDERHYTHKAYVDSLDTANVKLTGNQSVAGVKTFTGDIVVPMITLDGIDIDNQGGFLYVDGPFKTNGNLTMERTSANAVMTLNTITSGNQLYSFNRDGVREAELGNNPNSLYFIRQHNGSGDDTTMFMNQTNIVVDKPFSIQDADSATAGVIRLHETSANGSNYVGLRGPDSLPSNVNYIMPPSTGASVGDYLKIASISGNDITLEWGS